MKATVDYRKDARPGDMLWVWDSWRPRDRRPGVPFERGVFILRAVTALNRVTITLSGAGGFNIKTGVANRTKSGTSPIYGWAGGEIERELYRFYLDRLAIARAVERATMEQLKQIAEMFGYVPEDPPNAR